MTAPRACTVTLPLADGPVDVLFRGLTRDEWAALMLEHPPTDSRWRWDQTTLSPALIAACAARPTISLDLAGQLVDDPDVGPELVDVLLQMSVPGDIEWARRRLAADGRLADEVAAAVAMGIPHSAFTGWDDRSQDLALAHFALAREARPCPGCGVPWEDMADEAAWEPDVRSCWHCDALAKAREAIPETQRDHTHAFLVRPTSDGET